MSDIKPYMQPNIMLLAAGLSSRMGGVNKLLLQHEGAAMITHSAQFFRAHFQNVFIITGFEADKIKQACKGLDVRFIYNSDFTQGLETSFKAGLKGLPREKAPLMAALADQIFLNAADIAAVQTAYARQGGEKVIIPQYQGQRGHPILFPPYALDIMRAGPPVMSGRQFINRYSQCCHFIEMGQAHCIQDIDTPEDARQHLRPYET